MADSANASRVRLYRARKRAVEKLKAEPNKENLWAAVVAFENYPLKTTSGLNYIYSFKLNRHGEKGNELCVSRKSKTITRSSIEIAMASVVNLSQHNGYGFPVRLSTPKELKVFGASYIYPLFIRFGLVEHIGSHRRGGRRKNAPACE